MLDLSLAMLVREPPIASVCSLIDYLQPIVSQTVIIDTGSSEEDIAKMRALPNVELYQREWRNDFAWARNEALPYINRTWVLHLDPDELPNYYMMDHIAKVVNAPDRRELGWLYFSVEYLDGVRNAEYEWQWHVRLFKKGQGLWYRPLHELVSLGGQLEPSTRGTPRLLKAPKKAYFIHSKDAASIERSTATYSEMATTIKRQGRTS
jgi:hypothetical protein